MCLNQRDRRQLKANLWRTKVVLSRDKGNVRAQFIQPMIWLGVLFLMYFLVFKPKELVSTPFSEDNYGVFDSRTPATSNWVDSSSNLTSNLTFGNCTNYAQLKVGLIKKEGDSSKNGNDALDSIMTTINKAVSEGQGFEFDILTFKDNDEIDSFVKSADYVNQMLCFTLGWNVFDVDNAEFDIDLRFSQATATFSDQVSQQTFPFNAGLPSTYLLNGFLQVMTTVTNEIIQSLYDSDGTFTLMATPLPTGSYLNNSNYAGSLQYFFPFAMIMWSNLGSVLAQVSLEKNEDKLTSILKRIGYRPIIEVYRRFFVMLFSWLFMIPIAIVCLILMFKSVNVVIGLIIIMTVFFEMWLLDITLKYSLGDKWGLMIKLLYYGASVVLSLSMTYNPQQNITKLILFNLFAFTQLSVFGQLVCYAENIGLTIGFGNIGTPIFFGFSMLYQVAMVCGITFILLILFLYSIPLFIAVDEENPLRWYYPCVCGCLRRQNQQAEGQDQDNENRQPLLGQGLFVLSKPQESPKENDQAVNYLSEAERAHIAAGIMEKPLSTATQARLNIENLVKKYYGKKVVNNLSMTLFKDEILVLLGHNGAGKTTTINMLTGMVKPNSGTALAKNIMPNDPEVDLLKEYGNLVDFIGVCPQEDVLINRMTVEENLKFFALFKAIENSEQVIEDILVDFNLDQKRNTQAHSLSGGQKRKLQLAIALLGNAKIVLLDEPSSGMDPTARREAWDIIQKQKKDKIIILTTHYMDEAEQLADRVAIVSKGSLQACGSPFFLKQKYGQGFFIEIEPTEEFKDGNQEFTELIKEQLTAIDYQQEVKIQKNEQGKVVYELPYDICERFGILAEEMDKDGQRYGIKDYLIRSSTLEEVFITLGELEKKSEHQEGQDIEQNINDEDYQPEFEENGCCRLLMSSLKFKALSSIVTIISMFVVGGCAFVFAMAYAKFQLIDVNDPLNYSDMAAIYSTVTPMALQYNQQIQGSTESTEAFIQVTQAVAGQGTLDAQPQTWREMNSTESYEEYYSYIADQIPKENFGAYVIQDQPTADSKNYNVLIFGSLFSDGSFGSFTSVLLESIARSMTAKDDLKISFTNNPLPPNQFLSGQIIGGQFIMIFQFLLIAIDVIIISTILSRFETGFYDAVMMKGATKGTYWMSNYIVDVLITLILLPIFELSGMLFGIRLPGVWFLFIQFAIAQPLFLYTLSYYLGAVLKSDKLWVVTLVSFLTNIIAATLASLAGGMSMNKDTQTAVTIVLGVGSLFSPSSCLICGVESIFVAFNRHAMSLESDEKVDVLNGTPWYGSYGAQLQIFIGFGQLFLFGLLLAILLCGACDRKPKVGDLPPVKEENEDEDVANERLRVQQQGNDDLVLVRNLVKKYETKDPNGEADDLNASVRSDRPLDYNQAEEEAKNDPKAGTVAVKGTSFGVKEGECFALLGVNGAGKSTTFNCITGYDTASGGEVILDKSNVNTYFRKPHLMHKLVGYCPQTNCIDNGVPVLLTLKYFANLVGIPADQVDRAAISIMNKVGLEYFRNTAAGALSGGNKRKLCLAIALLGRPKIIYIDEASAGVDPGARRAMWKAIKSEGQGSAVIITTHAMEEAEALSSKLGIMVKGKIKCFGTPNHIKEKFGSGYEIELNIDLQDIAKELPQIQEQDRKTGDENLIKQYLADWQETLRNLDTPVMLKFVDEFSRFGLLGNFFSRIRTGEVIDLVSVQREVLLQNTVGAISDELTKKASDCFVQQLDGAYVRLKLHKNNKTYGQMYCLLQDMKVRFSIKEYQVKQSSLEQVFNSFATEDGYAFLNRRLTLARGNSVAGTD